jgi:hypothetical protein
MHSYVCLHIAQAFSERVTENILDDQEQIDEIFAEVEAASVAGASQNFSQVSSIADVRINQVAKDLTTVSVSGPNAERPTEQQQNLQTRGRSLTKRLILPSRSVSGEGSGDSAVTVVGPGANLQAEIYQTGASSSSAALPVDPSSAERPFTAVEKSLELANFMHPRQVVQDSKFQAYRRFAYHR